MRNLIERFARYHVQCPEAFWSVAGRIKYVGIRCDAAADDLHDVDAAGKRIGDRAENVSGKRLVIRIFAIDPVASHVVVSKTIFHFVSRRIWCKFDDVVKQYLQADEICR